MSEMTHDRRQAVADMSPKQLRTLRADIAAHMRQTATPDNPSAGMQRLAAELLEEDARNEPQRLLKLKDVLDMVPVCKAGLYRAIRRGDFPRPVKIFDGRGSAWSSREVDEWIRMRLEARFSEEAE